MTELEGLIRFWEATLRGGWWLLDPSVKVHIQNTITWLELLQSEKRG